MQEEIVKSLLPLAQAARQSYLTYMADQKPHPDAAAVDRIGTSDLMEHFSITRQAVSHWRRNGIPRTYRNAVVLYGESLGYDMSDVAQKAA